MGCEVSRAFAICLRACDLIREPEQKIFGVTDAPRAELGTSAMGAHAACFERVPENRSRGGPLGFKIRVSRKK